MLTHAIGDLFDPAFEFDAIGHGVNCKGRMGAGIAVAFREKYPALHSTYRWMCANHLINLGQVFLHETGEEPLKYIYNMATQDEPGANAELGALEISFLYVKYHAEENNLKRVGLPWIGAGIGGLSKAQVSDMMKYAFTISDVDFTVVTLPEAKSG